MWLRSRSVSINTLNNFPKERGGDAHLSFSGLYEPLLKEEDDGERPAAHVIGRMKQKLLLLPL